MNEKDKVDHLTQILKALLLLNDSGIHHWDIKPDNFLIDDKGYEVFLKLADFGLGKM